MKKSLLLMPVLAMSLLVGCANGNAYKPEDITLDMWLAGDTNAKNNMYRTYPFAEDSGEYRTPIDLDRAVINAIKENVTSTTPNKKIKSRKKDAAQEYLWYLLRSEQKRADLVMLYVYEDHIITSTSINYANDVYSQVLEYDLEPEAGKRILQVAKEKIVEYAEEFRL